MSYNVNQGSVQALPVSVDAYLKQGFKLTPIRPGTKRPFADNWNAVENTLSSSTDLPNGFGIGLCHAYTGTMALDVDDYQRAAEELAKHDIVLDDLFSARDAVTIVSGKDNHGKLLYKMPLGTALPSKKLIETAPDGVKYNYLDFRCGTAAGASVQDVLPPSIHPETRQPYQWGGSGDWGSLPEIPSALLAFWVGLIDKDQERKIRTGADISVCWDDVVHALEFINPDINRDEWVQVGMALHHAGVETNRLDEALHLWDEWSQGSQTKYQGLHDLTTSWRSFKSDGGIGLGTLFKIAGDRGWRRRLPDPEEVFKNVNVSTEIPDILNNEMPLLVDPTEQLRFPPPDVPMGLFPAVLSTRAKELAETKGCDEIIPLWAGLAAVSGAADARIRLQLMHEFKVPPVLWMMIVAHPSDKKTPGSDPMFGVLHELEKEDAPNHHRNKLAWQVEERKAKKEHERYLDHMSDAINDALPNDVPLEQPKALPPKPSPLKIKITDITSQQLVRRCAQHPRGVLCHLDEMGGWINRVVNPRSGEDRSCWVSSYESKSYDYERVSTGEIRAENMAVSIYGNIQTDILKGAVNSMGSDGLLQRFIPAILRPGTNTLGEPEKHMFSPMSQVYDQMIRVVYALPKTTYRMSPEAYEEFRRFQQWHLDILEAERKLHGGYHFVTAFGKLIGNAGRMALLFQLIEDPHGPEVSGERMRRVTRIMMEYVTPMMRYVYNEVVGESVASIDQWLADYVLQNSGLTPTITLRELKRGARRILDTDTRSRMNHQKDDIIKDAMHLLEKYQWVQIHEQNRGQVVWAINPKLAEVFKERREEIIRLKQERLDTVYKGARKTKGNVKRRFARGFEGDRNERNP